MEKGNVSRSRVQGKRQTEKGEALTSPCRLLFGSRLLSFDAFLKRLVFLALTFMFLENLTHPTCEPPKEMHRKRSSDSRDDKTTQRRESNNKNNPPTQTRSTPYPAYSQTCSPALWSRSLQNDHTRRLRATCPDKTVTPRSVSSRSVPTCTGATQGKRQYRAIDGALRTVGNVGRVFRRCFRLVFPGMGSR